MPLNRRDAIARAIAFVLGSAMLTGCGALDQRIGSGGVSDARSNLLKAGQRVPDFAVTTVDGKPISGAELIAQKRPYVLFFFATW